MEDSKTLPLEVYHGVPEGWSKEAVLCAHHLLGAPHQLIIPEATEPGAPSWLPDRYAWLQYREGIRAISAGIKEDCSACVELGIRYIEQDYIGSYSGYLKERLARVLASATASAEQRVRLLEHFEALAKQGQRRYEWRAFEKLAVELGQSTTSKARQAGTP